jgi:hypothetical protein
VIVGVIVALVWSLLLGIIIALIGLIAFLAPPESKSAHYLPNTGCDPRPASSATRSTAPKSRQTGLSPADFPSRRE